MKIRLLIFGCLITSSVLAQNRTVTNYYRYGENDYESKIESIESFDRNGNLTGPWTKFFRNGQLYIKGAYKNAKKEGIWKIYDKQFIVYLGQDSNTKSILRQEIGYKNGSYHGVHSIYIIDDLDNDDINQAYKKTIGRYTNGKKSGKWTYYGDNTIYDRREDGSNYNYRYDVDSVGEYRNGVKNGKWNYYSQKYYGKATPDSTGTYVNGLQEGIWNYYKNGKVVRTGKYEAGQKFGNWEYFEHVNDVQLLAKSGAYIEGKKEGNWKYYFNPSKVWDESKQVWVRFEWNADKYVIQNWKDGKKEGHWTEYYKTDYYLINKKGQYVDGLKEGVWMVLQSSDEYILSNHVIDSGNYVSGKKQGFWKVDQTQGQYVDGIKEGDWFEERFRGTYHNNLREGLWTNEDADKVQGSFKAGKKHGKWEFIYKNWNGDLESKWEGNYWNGYPIGKWKEYSGDGKFSMYSIDLDTISNTTEDEKVAYLLTEHYYSNSQLKHRIEGNVLFKRDSLLASPNFDAYGYREFLVDEEKNDQLQGYSELQYTENGELDFRNSYTVSNDGYDELESDEKLEEFQIVEFDLDSIKNGNAKREYSNGTIKYTLKGKKSTKTGSLTVYYPNGSIYLTGSIKNNMSVGNWVYYYQNGKIKERGVRVDTLIIEERWNDYEYEEPIPDDFEEIDSVQIKMRRGIWEFYNVNGQLKLREYELTDPTEDFEGLRTERMIYEWIPKTLTDEVISYYSNGSISSTGRIVKAKKVGVWKYYNIEGIKELEGDYNQDGFKIGEWRAYNYQGGLSAIRTYDKNGQKHGIQFVNMYQAAAGNWFKDSINYKHGIVQYPDGAYEVEEYEDMLTGTYKNNLKVGKWLKYTDFGDEAELETLIYDKKGKIIDRTYLIISEEDTISMGSDRFDYSSKILTSISYKSNGDTLGFSRYKLPKKKVAQDYQYKTSSNLLLSKGFYGKANNVTNETIKNGDEFIDYKFSDKGILLYETKYVLGPIENKIVKQEKYFFENGSIESLLIPEVLEETYYASGILKSRILLDTSMKKFQDVGFFYSSSGNLTMVKSWAGYSGEYYRLVRPDTKDKQFWKGYLIDEYWYEGNEQYGYDMGVKGNYANDQKIGEWTYEDMSGTVFRKGRYENGLENGRWLTSYHLQNDEVLTNYGDYENGERVGKWFATNEKSDTIIISNYLKTEEGTGVHYYPNGYAENYDEGKINYEFTEVEFVFGKETLDGSEDQYYFVDNTYNDIGLKVVIQGAIRSFYNDNDLKLTGHYDQSKKTGEWITYGMDGEIESKGSYIDGLEEGTWEYRYMYNHSLDEYQWAGEGDMEEFGWSDDDSTNFGYYTKNYKKGKLDGVYVEKNNSKDIIEEGHYINDKRSGVWSDYANGHISLKREYKNGIEHGHWVKYKHDFIIKEGVYKDGLKENTWTTYYAKDKKDSVVNYTNGIKDGTYTKYFYNGIISDQGDYTMGIKVGLWNTYDLYGQLTAVTNNTKIDSLNTFKPVHLLIPDPDGDFQSARSEKGQFLVSGSKGKYTLWDLSLRKVVRQHMPLNFVDFIGKYEYNDVRDDLDYLSGAFLSNSGRFLYDAGTMDKLYDLKKKIVHPHTGEIKDFSQNDSLFITTDMKEHDSYDRSNINNKPFEIRIYNTNTQKRIAEKEAQPQEQLEWQISDARDVVYELCNNEIITRDLNSLNPIGSIKLDNPIYLVEDGKYSNITSFQGSDIYNSDFEFHLAIAPKYFYDNDSYYFFQFSDNSEHQNLLTEITVYDLKSNGIEHLIVNDTFGIDKLIKVSILKNGDIVFIASKYVPDGNWNQAYYSCRYNRKTKGIEKVNLSNEAYFSNGYYKGSPIFNEQKEELIFSSDHYLKNRADQQLKASGFNWNRYMIDSTFYSESQIGNLSFSHSSLSYANSKLRFKLYEDGRFGNWTGSFEMNLIQAGGLSTTSLLDENKPAKDSTYINSLDKVALEEIFWGYEGARNVDNIFSSDNEKVIVHVDNQLLRFWNSNNTLAIERTVDLSVSKSADYVFYTPDRYYMGSKNIKDVVYFEKELKIYPFEQFDLKFNRPDIILDRLGYADSTLVQAYNKAYQKRLKKMGFTEDMLKDDFHLPEIKIENFEYMPSITDSTSVGLNIHLNDSKYKLDRINIWVNDVAVYGSDGISLREQDLREYKSKIDVNLVKGHNKIQVSVLNQAGAESYKETIEIETTAGKVKPDLYLITIGESEFKDSNYNLTYAAKDAEDIATLFSKSVVYHKVFTKTLTNEQVTKVNIEALQGFISEAGINDEVMVFIAGHGVLDQNLDYFFATYDMDFNNPAEKGLAYEDLEGLLDGIKPLKKIMFVDACHSGEIDKEEVELIAQNTTTIGGVQFRAVGNTVTQKLGIKNTSELTKALFTDLRKGTGATVISSAGGMEFAMEGDDWNNGLFTYCLINGIKSKEADLNKDGEIWLSELKQYVSKQVTKLSNGKQQPTSRIENQVLDYRVW